MKLTAKQQDILDKMANGWELGYHAFGPDGWHCIQQGRLGYGGESHSVNANTVQALYRRGLIKQIYGFPISKYILVKEEK